MLSVFITGDGDITHENAKALLDDYLPPELECTIFIDRNYELDLGMCNVVDALGILCRTSIRMKPENFLVTSGRRVVLLLGYKRDKEGHCLPMSLRNSITLQYFNGLEILAMDRGLMALPVSEPASELPLYGPHLNAAPTKVLPQPTVPPAASNPHLCAQSPGSSEASIEETNMRAHVTTREENWHSPVPQAPVIPEGTTPYYKSKTGKLRKAGKSKARPGEELVYLTEEEVNDI